MKKVDLYEICYRLWERANDSDNQGNLLLEISELEKRLRLKQRDFADPALEPLRESWFEQFVAHPQISSWLVKVIRFHYLCVASELPQMDAGILGETCDHCVQVLQSNWGAGDHEIAAFRKFWELILVFHDTEKEDAQAVLGMEPEIVEIFSSTMEYNAREYRLQLEKELQTEYVPLKESYNKIRRDYRKKIEQHYRMGFIYLLGEYQFNDFYIPPTLECETGPNSFLYSEFKDTLDWENIFKKNNIIYVIGAPGTGKSLFLRNILNNYAKLGFYDSRDYLVIYCDLKTYYTNGGSNKKSIPDFLQESIINTIGMDEEEISADFIRYHLSLGRCLVLLDALDEVPKNKRHELHKKAITYFKTANGNNRICITSRSRGFIPQEDITVLKIPALSQEDISAYIDRMIKLKKFREQDKETFLQQAQVLIEKHFLSSFLVLSLLVNIYKAEKELPENKINLYKKCFEYIAKKREEEKAKIDYDWAAISPMMKDSTFINLAVLAVPNNAEISRGTIEKMLLDLYKNKYSDEATAENAIKQFLDFCSARTELFVLSNTANDDRFRFFHRSFFEYFYSRYIAQQPSAKAMYQLMTQFDVDSEVFELTVALVKEENEKRYQELIDYIFTQIETEFQLPTPKYTAFSMLTLSLQVVDDIQYLRRYFDIVVSRPELMDSEEVQSMNQRLIELGIDSIMKDSDTESKRFCEAYRHQYIAEVVDMMNIYVDRDNHTINMRLGAYARSRFSPMVSEQELRAIDVYLPGRRPFYLLAYPQREADALREEVLHWDRAQMEKFFGREPNTKIRRKRRITLKALMELSMTDRERFWRALTGQAIREDKAEAVVIP